MASGPCVRRCRVVRRYIPIRLQLCGLAVRLYHSMHVPMYDEPFWEGNAVTTGVPCPKVTMHRKLGSESHTMEILCPYPWWKKINLAASGLSGVWLDDQHGVYRTAQPRS